jgi:hypothetical protein
LSKPQPTDDEDAQMTTATATRQVLPARAVARSSAARHAQRLALAFLEYRHVSVWDDDVASNRARERDRILAVEAARARRRRRRLGTAGRRLS